MRAEQLELREVIDAAKRQLRRDQTIRRWLNLGMFVALLVNIAGAIYSWTRSCP